MKLALLKLCAEKKNIGIKYAGNRVDLIWSQIQIDCPTKNSMQMIKLTLSILQMQNRNRMGSITLEKWTEENS